MRGTITSRAMVSPNSKTEWIIFRSPDSITAEASAKSTSSRSSVSVANGPSRNPRPGVMALPIRISSFGSGPSTRVTTVSGGADTSATRSGCWRPRVRGATPITTNETTSMIPIEVSAAIQNSAVSQAVRTSWVTMTIAAISQSSRRNSAVLR